MIFGMVTGCASTQEIVTTTTVEVDGYDITVKETNTKREATTTVEGVPIACEHTLNSDEYWLHLSDVSYELDVQILEDGIEVKFKDEITSVDYEDVVVGQSLTLALAVPAFIEAGKWIIAIAAGYTTIKGISISADAIGDVISGIRYNTKTYYNYRTVDVTAADAIRFGRMNKSNAYYEAYLKGNTVFISRQIDQFNAVWRLKNGYDVFATTNYAAFTATYQAAVWTGKGGIIQHSYMKNEGYYPHYHPVGRKWVNDSSRYPHCWYPF